MIEHIRTYLAQGLSLMPIRYADKRPLLKEWGPFAITRADAAQMNAWWKEHSGKLNVGIIFSSSEAPEDRQLVCLDSDGEEEEAWIQTHAPLPVTPSAETARGFHRYFYAPRGLHHTAAKDGKPAILAENHYAVLPPSVHPTGVVYSWLPGLGLEDVPIADLPAWGVTLMLKSEPELPPATPRQGPRANDGTRERKYGLAALKRQADTLATISEGGRNDALNNAGFVLGQLVGGGCLEEPEVTQTLLAACQSNGLLKDDGLRACEKTLTGALRAGQAVPREVPQGNRPQARRATAQATDAEDPRPDDAAMAHLMEQAEASVNGIDTRTEPGRRGVAPAKLSDIASGIMEAFDAERKQDRAIRGLRTGFPTLDAHFCGFARQQLVVIHGLSGYGKSHFANHCVFATALAEQEKGAAAAWTVVFLCEGMASSLFSAYLGYQWAVPERCREAGSEKYMTVEIEDAIMLGKEEFRNLPILVTDEIKKLTDIEEYIRRTVAERPVAGVVIDHMQEIKAPGCKNPSHQGVDLASERLRDLSEKELHVPIVVLSQTTPDQKGNCNPKYGTAIREKSSLCWQVDRGKAGEKREDAVQSPIMRVINDKSRWKRVLPTLTLMGDYETGRMWEEAEYNRLQHERAGGYDGRYGTD